MKVVILAGGLGTRLAEETQIRPKPMVEIGGRPILWHIMKIYQHFGMTDVIICLGYKGYMIKEYFANYALHTSNVTFDFRTGAMQVHDHRTEPWRVTLVDTGDHSMTGGRLKRVRDLLGDQDFCLTYGDGVGSVDLRALIKFHQAHGRLATVTAVRPTGRFGAMNIEDNLVKSFHEKPDGDGGWVNGGFFVLNPKVIDYIANDGIVWEREPVMRLVAEGQMAAYYHGGFWQPMDTLRDKYLLEELWNSGNAPWKIWS